MSNEIESKDIYTAEEKKMILERLDAERKARQEEKTKTQEAYTEEDKKSILERINADRKAREEAERQERLGKKKLTLSEKEKILEKINEERRIAQKYKELQRRRLRNKKIYHLENRVLYKFLNMDRAYYIQVEDCKRLSSRPLILPLFYQGFDGLKQKDVLIRIRDYSDKIFISDDVIRVYYKEYSLEDNPVVK
ncbi:hypothetical protein PGH07_06395 [Sulfurovum sp. zt1-1]|uniref:Uncharacterized protein n=1 Tax=Sulfurovum zhangzhouensis TaxID=3019067 RepID=A0ABT7QY89_9BACT|nr:hypothetical protein [Sulfurovum zhangzhouensis]MDM5271800.1 hypothetical protein [Sulfurovum zhangzhouensis]